MLKKILEKAEGRELLTEHQALVERQQRLEEGLGQVVKKVASVAAKVAGIAALAYWGVARLKSMIDSRSKKVVEDALKGYKPKVSDLSGKVGLDEIKKGEIVQLVRSIVEERVRVRGLQSRDDVRNEITRQMRGRK